MNYCNTFKINTISLLSLVVLPLYICPPEISSNEYSIDDFCVEIVLPRNINVQKVKKVSTKFISYFFNNSKNLGK